MPKRGSNEGSIYRMKDGRWRAAVSVGWKDGKRVRKTFTGKTRSEVSEKLKATLRAQQLGLPIAPDRQTVAQFLTHWLRESAKPRVRPRTFESYSWIIRHHLIPGIGRIRLTKLGPQPIQAFLKDRRESGLSPRSVQHIHATLRAALGQAEKWALVPRNVAKLVEVPRVERQPVNVMSPEDVPTYFEAVRRDRLEALYVLSVALGLRQGEALGLQWDAIDFERGTLTVRCALQRVEKKLRLVEPKTARSRRTLHLPQFVTVALLAHKARQEQEREWAGTRWSHSFNLVFTTTIGTPLDSSNVTHRLHRLLERAGLRRMRFHDLRHSCASLLLSKGVHMRLIMETLGHSQISLTMDTYAHVVPSMRREVAAKMDEVFDPVATSVATSGLSGRLQ